MTEVESFKKKIRKLILEDNSRETKKKDSLKGVMLSRTTGKCDLGSRAELPQVSYIFTNDLLKHHSTVKPALQL